MLKVLNWYQHVTVARKCHSASPQSWQVQIVHKLTVSVLGRYHAVTPTTTPYASPRTTSMGPLVMLNARWVPWEKANPRNIPNKAMQMTSSNAPDTINIVGRPLSSALGGFLVWMCRRLGTRTAGDMAASMYLEVGPWQANSTILHNVSPWQQYSPNHYCPLPLQFQVKRCN